MTKTLDLLQEPKDAIRICNKFKSITYFILNFTCCACWSFHQLNSSHIAGIRYRNNVTTKILQTKYMKKVSLIESEQTMQEFKFQNKKSSETQKAKLVSRQWSVRK